MSTNTKTLHMEKHNKDGVFFQPNTEGDLQHPGGDHQCTEDYQPPEETTDPEGKEDPTVDKGNGGLSDFPTETKIMDGTQG